MKNNIKMRLFPTDEQIKEDFDNSIFLLEEKENFDISDISELYVTNIKKVFSSIEENFDSVMEEAQDDSHKRLMAEFQNYRTRTIKEKSELMKTASKKVICDILSVVDDFERAEMSEGIELIYKKLKKTLSDHGCVEIDVTDKEFDSEIMEAITTIPMHEKKNIVIDTLQKGYMMNDVVIRFPKVVIGE